MRFAQWGGCSALLLVAGLLVSSTGCGKDDKKGGDAQAKAKDDHKDHKNHTKGGKTEISKSDTKHDGWWCQEHGVPEELCSLCSDELTAKSKKEGDWCKLHDRAKSQCFKCEPGLYKKYEAMYEAKFGKKPEPPSKEEFEK